METREAEAFLYKEARLLDTYELHEWRRLFTDDAIYWVPLNESDYDPMQHISICYDDMKHLEGRIWRVMESGMNHTQDPPSRFMRLVSNVEVDNTEGDDTPTVYSNLLLSEFRSGGQRKFEPRYFAARCQHKLRKEGDEWRITFKKISLIQNDGILNAMTFII